MPIRHPHSLPYADNEVQRIRYSSPGLQLRTAAGQSPNARMAASEALATKAHQAELRPMTHGWPTNRMVSSSSEVGCKSPAVHAFQAQRSSARLQHKELPANSGQAEPFRWSRMQYAAGTRSTRAAGRLRDKCCTPPRAAPDCRTAAARPTGARSICDGKQLRCRNFLAYALRAV